MADFRRLLVPTDFTDTSERALDWAFAFAERVGASVSIMHAYELPIVGFPDGALGATAEIATRMNDAARMGLERVTAKRSGGKVPVQSILREGVPWEEITK